RTPFAGVNVALPLASAMTAPPGRSTFTRKSPPLKIDTLAKEIVAPGVACVTVTVLAENATSGPSCFCGERRGRCEDAAAAKEITIERSSPYERKQRII